MGSSRALPSPAASTCEGEPGAAPSHSRPRSRGCGLLWGSATGTRPRPAPWGSSPPRLSSPQAPVPGSPDGAGGGGGTRVPTPRRGQGARSGCASLAPGGLRLPHPGVPTGSGGAGADGATGSTHCAIKLWAFPSWLCLFLGVCPGGPHTSAPSSGVRHCKLAQGAWDRQPPRFPTASVSPPQPRNPGAALRCPMPGRFSARLAGIQDAHHLVLPHRAAHPSRPGTPLPGPLAASGE